MGKADDEVGDRGRRNTPDEGFGADPTETDPRLEGDFRRSTAFRRLARRLMDPRELGGDALELLGTVVETSDRAKTEMVRMLAREIRHYLEELKLKDDLKELITGHSLEVHLSLSLKPLADDAGDSAGGPSTPEGSARRADDGPGDDGERA